MRFSLLAAVLAAIPCAAAAAPKMLVATSTHFTIYSGQDEATLLTFAQDLEVYDAVLRRMTGTKAEEADAPPLSIYVRPDQRTVDGGYGVLGYYIGPAEGPLAVVPGKVQGYLASDYLSTGLPREILFHEYAHHVLLQDFPALYSPWFIEGLAEFYSTAEIGPETVLLGKPVATRVGTLRDRRRHTTLRYLLDPGKKTLNGAQVDELYARGWLMVHYLTLSKQRGGQISAYLRDRSRGVSEEQAFLSGLGTGFDGMDEELRAYFAPRTLNYVGVARPRVAPIGIRPASEGEAAVAELTPTLRYLQTVAAGRVGATITRAEQDSFDRAAEKLAADFRDVGRRLPDDSLVQLLGAESHLLADRRQEAEAMVQRALVLRPKDARALLLSARLVRPVPGADPAAIDAYRRKVVAANRAAPNDPLPLIAYYRSYADYGLPRPSVAVYALDRAHQLAPQDDGVGMMLAREAIGARDFARAAQVLRPIAFAPHARRQREAAQTLLNSLPSEHETAPPPMQGDPTAGEAKATSAAAAQP